LNAPTTTFGRPVFSLLCTLSDANLIQLSGLRGCYIKDLISLSVADPVWLGYVPEQ